MPAELVPIPPLVLTAKPNPSEEDDMRWLEGKVQTWAEGVKAAADAACDIARNWVDGRQVGRYFPDVTVYEFLSERFGAIRLPPPERNDFIVKLVGSGISARKAAKLTGVSHPTVLEAVKGGRNLPPRKRGQRSEPSAASRLAHEVDGILGGSATLPHDLAEWLASEPSRAEREPVAAAIDRLYERVGGLKEALT